jgi:hypothetical protein
MQAPNMYKSLYKNDNYIIIGARQYVYNLTYADVYDQADRRAKAVKSSFAKLK